jgi:Ca2+-binding EF-hand superfamily protein
MGSSPLDSLK